ncbi:MULTISPECIES: trigger factor-related chaperone [unclassified Mycoplasma]|uniref:trigger factor-related chaperone n=1 Tax=unclassified Mycoplasma TaxID=2683645 RepID=UPI00211CAD2F|nr:MULTISPECIES: hypothetical protein [unclassified Mycoplasma]UUM20106.1 hypothetical protein NPA11_01625 [Mycoplasma sp. 1578d]UUM25086.1 hypothetical protein NPA12_01600 [Mycoplasma sp. 3686d]
MKFLTQPIQIDVVTWVDYQSKALKALQQQAQSDSSLKITQDKILDYAYKLFVMPEMQKVWNSYLNKKDHIVYFRPMDVKHEVTPEKINAEFKIYYYEELNHFNTDFEPEVKFKMPENYEEMIKNFTDNFIKDYAFRFYLEKDKVIQEGQLVSVKVSDKDKKNVQMHTIYASPNENQVLENLVLGKKVGQTFESDKLGSPLMFEIESAVYFKNAPITDENAKEILGKNFTNLQDVKADIYQTTRAQIYNEALFQYGTGIIDQLIKSSKVVEIPDDLVQNDLEHFNFGPEFQGNPSEFVIATIYNFFWQMIFRIKLNLDITEQEFKNEFAYAQNFFPIESQNSIRPEMVVNAIIIKKIALYYLAKYDSQRYQDNQKYSHLNLQ